MDGEWIRISLSEQQLELCRGDEVLARFPVSTARNGPGEEMDSECTPRGEHVISEKIGGGCAERSVFVGREPTGEICTPGLFEAEPERDWILTRILWLDGREDGRNRGGRVDSHERYVYIHGTPDEASLGAAKSHGCVRMANRDVTELFERVQVGTRVLIEE